jgi:hypothetical protein
MDFSKVESSFAADFRRKLGRTALVATGPMSNPSFSRTRVQVNVHISEFDDLGGVTADGAHIGRRPVTKKPDFIGYAEERTGRIVGCVYVAATSYSMVARLSGQLAPEILAACRKLKAIQLGRSLDKNSTLVFSDYTAFLNTTQTRLSDTQKPFYLGVIEFYLDGFLHVKVLTR